MGNVNMQGPAPRPFLALLSREVIEHRNLFVVAPAVLAIVLLVFALWLVVLVPEQLAAVTEYLSAALDGLSPLAMAPVLMLPAIPFLLLLYLCGLIYLLSALYQERRDMSVLFWQSMPVSDFHTVLSKVVTVVTVAPVFPVAALSALYLLGAAGLTLLTLAQGVEVAGHGTLLLAALASLALVYLSAVVASLWLLPTVGWLLLFSAFARQTPLLWAAGVFLLIGFLEDFVFGSQYLANWVASRSNPDQYLIYRFSDVPTRLFSYDLLFGLLVGAVLLAGAVRMRRFID